MKTGWYLSGGEGWYWDSQQQEFTDHLNEHAIQWSYVSHDVTNHQKELMEENFRDAKSQIRNPFTQLDGPYEFDEICDGQRLLQS
jgi:hypothetical protein